MTILSEGEDHKLVDFNGETLSFTCPMVKKKFIALNEITHDSTVNKTDDFVTFI